MVTDNVVGMLCTARSQLPISKGLDMGTATAPTRLYSGWDPTFEPGRA